MENAGVRAKEMMKPSGWIGIIVLSAILAIGELIVLVVLGDCFNWSWINGLAIIHSIGLLPLVVLFPLNIILLAVLKLYLNRKKEKGSNKTQEGIGEELAKPSE